MGEFTKRTLIGSLLLWMPLLQNVDAGLLVMTLETDSYRALRSSRTYDSFFDRAYVLDFDQLRARQP
ncbi:MAG: hypothetical protein JWQ35_687 [Bacteriovoracaceae bacterium]|nr:hypothetical protein [Bacteriovoracaceae bacterium]